MREEKTDHETLNVLDSCSVLLEKERLSWHMLV